MSEYIFKANFKIDNCLTCPVSNIVMNCPCFTGQAYATDFCDSKHPNCPLKELPQHGDLIDRRKLWKDTEGLGEYCHDRDFISLCDAIADAPTILEASKQD